MLSCPDCRSRFPPPGDDELERGSIRLSSGGTMLCDGCLERRLAGEPNRTVATVPLDEHLAAVLAGEGRPSGRVRRYPKPRRRLRVDDDPVRIMVELFDRCERRGVAWWDVFPRGFGFGAGRLRDDERAVLPTLARALAEMRDDGVPADMLAIVSGRSERTVRRLIAPHLPRLPDAERAVWAARRRANSERRHVITFRDGRQVVVEVPTPRPYWPNTPHGWRARQRRKANEVNDLLEELVSYEREAVSMLEATRRIRARVEAIVDSEIRDEVELALTNLNIGDLGGANTRR